MKSFRLIIAVSSLLGFGLLACGKSPNKPSGGVTSGSAAPAIDADGDGVDDATGQVLTSLPKDVSMASFKANLYEPVLKPYCDSCHHSTFVESDLEKAHDAFVDRSDLDKFAGVDLTLPVVKMKQAHNCWEASTKTCVTVMQEKMTLWLKDLEANGYKPTPVKYPNATAEVAMSSAAPITLTIPQEYAYGGIDTATVNAPFTKMTDDVDGPFKTYATSPMGTARANNANAAQSIVFNMNVKVPGTYFVWARVKTLADTGNEFFVGANGANPVAFIAPVTGKDAWKWAQMFTVNNNQNTATPFSFNVAAAGTIPVNVVFREAQARINQLVITSKPDFNGDQFITSYMDISVPLNVPGAEGAKIVATVWELTKEEGKRSLGVKELKIVSPVPLHVKGIYPLINGFFSANNGTYTKVDTKAGGPDASQQVISTGGSTSSTWIADITKDKLGFAFDVIEVAK